MSTRIARNNANYDLSIAKHCCVKHVFGVLIIQNILFSFLCLIIESMYIILYSWWDFAYEDTRRRWIKNMILFLGTFLYVYIIMIGIYLISVNAARRRQCVPTNAYFVPPTTSCNNCMVACAIKIYTSIVRGDAKNVVVRVST